MQFIAITIALLTLGLVSVGSLPPFRMNRSTLALVGATALMLLQPGAFHESLSYVNGPTLILLFAMMVLNSNMHYAGFFDLVASWLLRFAVRPRLLLFIVMVLTAVLSAFLVNDTLIMVFTPLLIEVLDRTRVNPYPFLMGTAFSVNIGSMATLIGNPQNILIGTSSGMDFLTFFSVMGPLSALLLLLAYLLILLTQPMPRPTPSPPSLTPKVYFPLTVKSLLGLALMVVAFFINVPISLAALAGIALVLVTRRISPDKVFGRVDWSLLVLFASLFVITGTLRDTQAFELFASQLLELLDTNPFHMAWIAPLFSQVISNVPTTMILIPVVAQKTDPTLLWYLLSGSTTLAGNLTLLGSVANLILAESAAKRGIYLGFWQYFRLGFLVSVITIAVFTLILLFLFSSSSGLPH